MTSGRALIVSTGRARGTLTAARALADAGWEVGVGTPDGDGLAARSRATSHTHVVPRPRGDLRDFASAMSAAESAVGYDVVFGGGDDWMAALAQLADDLGARVAHPPHAVLLRGLDKLHLARRAALVGLATPDTMAATDDVLDGWDGPIVVKCRSHWSNELDHPYRIETRAFDRVDGHVRDQIRSIADHGLEPIVQQPVDGELGALIGVFDGRRLHGVVQQRAARVWPTPTGVSARAVTTPVDASLLAASEALLADLEWSGLVELQFLHDDAGTAHFIDLNARFYGSMSLALATVGNLPDAWARQTLGDPSPVDQLAATAEPGRRFLWVAGDLRRALTERRHGVVADVASTVRWAASRRLARVWHPFDPGPTWHVMSSRFRSSGADPES